MDILINNQFHISHWKELNDPMEGFFQYLDDKSQSIYNGIAKSLITEKNRYKICSFSGTYHPILLWTNYANVHNGIAIEITLDPNDYNLHRVTYNENIPELDNILNKKPNLDAIDVLKRKIKIWAYEEEYRVIKESYSNECQIGEITGLYWGIKTESYYKELILNILPAHIKTFDTEIDFEKNIIIKKLTLDNNES